MVSACKEAAEQFPVGLKVLVVDDDATCLRILEQMLRKCTYTVTTCFQAKDALNLLRGKKGFFDVVLSDVHMPDMDGFKLLELVGLEMDLPVIMMSGDDRKSLVMRGIRHGACDYLIKPIRIEELKNIWQHVVRKRCTVSKENELSGSPEDNDQQRHGNDDSEYASCVNDEADGGSRTQKKRKDTKEDDADLDDEPGTSKKQRVVWSVELHQQFVSAVNQLGIDKAVPKRILELMNVPGLTRENVASHLQKFRLYLKRLSGVAQLHGGLPSQFCAPLDSISQAGSTVGRFDIQALAASGQIPPQTLAALHAELLNQPTSTVVLPAMGQSSLPATKCTNLDQNIAYGQPLGKCSSIASNHFSQEFCSADNVQPGLGSWSSKSPISVVNCDNLTGFATNNGGAMIDIMNHQTRELRQPHEHPQRQSAFPEASRTINVQPSCLVASHSSPIFQAGNSFGSANISRSLGGSSNINYNMLMPQSNNPQLDNGRVQDLEIKRASRLGGLSGFGSSSPVRLSSGSLNANNGIGMEVPASRSNGIRPFSALAPNASNFLDSYDAPSENFLDQRMLQSTGFFGGAAPVPSHIHTDETRLTFNHGDRENMYGDNIGNNKVKQEASMTFRENGKGGVPRLSHNECFF